MEIKENFIRIRRPDDGHCHLRNGEILELIAPTLNIFGRVTAIGNLPEPIVASGDIEKYRREIESARDIGSANKNFTPVMTVMLTKYITPEILKLSWKSGAKILKFIPKGTSTNSNHGVSFYELPKYFPVIAKAAELGMILSIHCELSHDHNGNEIHPLLREKESLPFIQTLAGKFQSLKIIMEHISTSEAIEFVKHRKGKRLAASLTEKHALMTYADVCDNEGHITKALNYCKPIFKFEADRLAVRNAMTSGDPKFFFGSDSAPHPAKMKIGNDPAAGIYSHAEDTIALLTEIFEKECALRYLERFVSENWAKFCSYPLNDGEITINKQPHTIPRTFGNSPDFGYIPVFKGGEKVSWTVAKNI